jgi:hypothetical protein
MEIVVDNTAGGDRRFAADVATRLREQGLVVELREPAPATMFDTAVHVVSAGLAIRVSERPGRPLLRTIEEAVRAVLLQRPGLRARTKSVPVHLGQSGRVLQWIDVIE